jgi:hypothetical protein
VDVAESSVEDLAQLIAVTLNGKPKSRGVVAVAGLEDILITANDSGERTEEFADSSSDFLFYPYYLDIEADTATVKTMIATVGKLLEALWDAGIPAVAACDYEDDLPEAGGIGAAHRWLRDE